MAMNNIVASARSARASDDQNRLSPPPQRQHLQQQQQFQKGQQLQTHPVQPQPPPAIHARRASIPPMSPPRPGVRFAEGTSGYGTVRTRSRSVGDEDAGSLFRPTNEEDTRRFWWPSITQWFTDLNKAHAATIFILFYVNLINYMDRSVVAGMMDNIKNDLAFHKPSDTKLGLLQTVFVIFYMIFAPLFGYLGDRYNRKVILCIGLSIWCFATFAGSFATNFWLFLFFRAVVGIGEASYSTIAPALISDLFVKDVRSRVLALFYFAIPLGIGLGYMIGSGVATCFGDWRWGLRVTPFMGLVSIGLIIFFMIDPERGLSDGAQTMAPSVSWKEDVKSLANNRSFVLATMGFTCVTFSVGALMWWGPNFAFYGAKAICGNKAGCENITQNEISYRFGIVMAFAGLLGVPLGSTLAQLIRHKVPNADPIVCGTTLLLSVPVMYAGFLVARFSTEGCYGLTFLAGLLLNCNWSVVSDMTLYIVIPPRRSFASATQILFSHLLGDAISPYLIGAISDAIRENIDPNMNPTLTFKSLSLEGGIMEPINSTIGNDSSEYYDAEFRSQQYALFLCCFFQAFGSLFFLATSWYVVDDKLIADRAILSEIDAMDSGSSTGSSSGSSCEDDDDVEEGSDPRQPLFRSRFADEAD